MTDNNRNDTRASRRQRWTDRLRRWGPILIVVVVTVINGVIDGPTMDFWHGALLYMVATVFLDVIDIKEQLDHFERVALEWARESQRQRQERP